MIARTRQHPPPRINDHRIAVIGKAMNVGTKLRWCQDVALILDCAGPYQDLPMCFARRKSKCAGNSDNVRSCIDQTPVQLGKPHVVTHTEADCSNLGSGSNDLRTRHFDVGFLNRNASWKIDVEQMDLTVNGELLAVGSKQYRSVIPAALVWHVFGN